MGHIYSASHRLTYLECFFPIVRRKFAKVPNLGVWEKSTFNHLDSVITRIEARLGRLNPWVVLGRHFLNIEMEGIRKVIESGKHFKEAVGLNFRTIPDPFEAYIKKLSRKEIVEIDEKGNDPKGRPGIDLSVPFSQTKPLSYAEKYDMQKNTVMNKIAHLRKEIKDDDKFLSNNRKYRDDVSKKKSLPKSNNASTSDNQNQVTNKVDEDLEVISDEDVSSETNLKLRKPEKRGIMSRNPDGIGSRKDKSSMVPDRVLYMDREDKDKESAGDRERERNRSSRERERNRSSRERERKRSPRDKERNKSPRIRDRSRERNRKDEPRRDLRRENR